jgi:transposase
LVRELAQKSIPTSIVNPFYARSFAKSRQDLAKTDKIDCKVLAEYGEKMEPRISVPKTTAYLDLEELTHRRDNLVEMLKEEKQRFEKDPSDEIKTSISRVVSFLEGEKAEVEAKLRECIAANEQVKEISDILQSEKGVGEQTAAILIGNLPELLRLDNRQIAKLCGLAPMTHDSGQMRGYRSIRGGRARVRQALYMASVSAIRSHPVLQEFYQRLRNEGKPGKVAMVAVARKLLIILNAKMRHFYNEEEIY